jgi:rhamnose transport system permease protein
MSTNSSIGKSRAESGADFAWRRWLFRPEWVTLLLLIIAIWIGSTLSPYFADLRFVLESASPYIEFGLIALVLTLIIITGEIDLSVASIMALCGVVFAQLFHAGVPVGIAITLTLLLGLAAGYFNGTLVTRLGIPSIILTIGTLTLYRGIAQILLGDRSLGRFPSWFVGIDWITVGIVPVPVIVFFVAAALLGFVLHKTVLGRQIYQIGTNPLTARLSGIPVDRIKLGLFCLSGVVSAIAGLMTVSRLGVARFDMARGGELEIVLIVMLGGTYIFGGRGNMLGTVMALWLLVVMRAGMNVANIKIESQLTVLGLLLIIAIIVSDFIYRKSER